ncbi:hypothetical protein EON66_08555 [archaeon]|nr:MAG: hypothetical protein EON66_08555 [archaeon]
MDSLNAVDRQACMPLTGVRHMAADCLFAPLTYVHTHAHVRTPHVPSACCLPPQYALAYEHTMAALCAGVGAAHAHRGRQRSRSSTASLGACCTMPAFHATTSCHAALHAFRPLSALPPARTRMHALALSAILRPADSLLESTSGSLSNETLRICASRCQSDQLNRSCCTMHSRR